MAHTPLADLLSRALHQVRHSRRQGIPLDEVVDQQAERARSRRNLLKGALAVGAGLALPGLARADEVVASVARVRRKPVVAIIGGGTAGLTCAYRLKQQGLSATVYEASARTGGRMLSDRTTFAGARQVCELGGEFIDTGHTAIRGLVRELGLKLEDKARDVPGLTDLVGYFGGRRVPYRDLLTAFAPIAEAIDASLATLTVPDNGISYADPNGGAWLDRLSLSQWFDRRRITGLGRQLIEVAHTIEWGLDPGEMNAYDMLGLISTDTARINVFGDSDERFHIAGGNDQVPAELTKRLANQIATGQVLEAIRQQADGRYALTFRQGGGCAEVVADHVVSAIPFKILRTLSVQVDLPTVKRRAIKEMGYGQNTKCMTGFRNRPWRDQGSDGQAFSDLTFQNCWDSAQMQAGAHGILTEFTGGSQALVAAKGTTADRARQFVGQIDRVYPGCAAAATGAAVRLPWNTMPYAQGSYSAYLVGQYTRFAGTEGERVGNLHFAGEHTDFDNQGYMEGAVVSGERCADEILGDIGGCTATG